MVIAIDPPSMSDLPLWVAFGLLVLETISLAYVLFRKQRNYEFREWSLIVLLTYLLCIAIGYRTSLYEWRQYLSLLLSGVLAFFIGWLVRYHPYLLRGRHSRPKLLINSVIHILVGDKPRVRHLSYLGAWIELIGVAAVLHSVCGFLASSVVFPLMAYVAAERHDQWRAKTKPDSGFDRWRKTRPAIWPGALKSVRIVFAPLIVALFTAVLAREGVLFWGLPSNVTSILIALAEMEATVGILVITLAFVLVEITATYSTRLVRILTQRRPFAYAVVAFAMAIVYNLGLAANSSRWLPTQQAPTDSLLVDIAFVLAGIAGFTLGLFVKDALVVMSPEAMVEEALKDFDSIWLSVVRKEWSGRFGPRSMHVSRDPMILVERLLNSALNRGDVNSFRTGLMILSECIQRIAQEDDLVILDKYLAHHLRNLIRIAARQASAEALFALCDFIQWIGTPSKDSILNTEAGIVGTPPGSALPRMIVDEAIEFELAEPAQQALYIIQELANHTLQTLPSLEEVWRHNPNRPDELAEEIRRELRENDQRIDNYKTGYLGYLAEKGQEAIAKGLRWVAWLASGSITVLIGAILRQVPDAPIQIALIRHAFWSQDRIVSHACMHKCPGAITLGFGFEFDELENEVVAESVAHYLTRFTISMARARILDWMTVSDVAFVAVTIAPRFPQAATMILKAFGEAAKDLRQEPDFAQQEELVSIHAELVSRIDQIEKAALGGGIDDEVRSTATQARAQAGEPLGRPL
jgi:hypothetical protein